MSYFISVYAVMALQTCAIGSVLAADEAGWAAAAMSAAAGRQGGGGGLVGEANFTG